MFAVLARTSHIDLLRWFAVASVTNERKRGQVAFSGFV
jgi:hypothetical protein